MTTFDDRIDAAVALPEAAIEDEAGCSDHTRRSGPTAR